MDLGSNHVISQVLSQGRFANGQGQEYTQAYRIHYWREGMTDFKEYRDSIGKTVRRISIYTIYINDFGSLNVIQNGLTGSSMQ